MISRCYWRETFATLALVVWAFIAMYFLFSQVFGLAHLIPGTSWSMGPINA